MVNSNSNLLFPLFTSEGMKPTDILSLVFTMVEGICKSSFPFVKFHCGPACPCIKCPGYQDCLPHPGEQSSRPKRRHVFNILPARLEQRTSNSFYCVNKNFRDGLKEWEDFKRRGCNFLMQERLRKLLWNWQSPWQEKKEGRIRMLC